MASWLHVDASGLNRRVISAITASTHWSDPLRQMFGLAGSYPSASDGASVAQFTVPADAPPGAARAAAARPPARILPRPLPTIENPPEIVARVAHSHADAH